ncbi:MAG: chemotaxis protein CheD [Armatimonadetes bacterium]|nr:chemotaxis protein CheD [Armatimonadota bacterium]
MFPSSLKKRIHQPSAVHEAAVAGRSVFVGMGEIEICTGEAQFTCLGIGSCIALTLADTAANLWGVAHITLPQAFGDRPVTRPGEFADTGVAELVRLLEEKGASRENLRAAYAGGSGGLFDVGARNSQAVRQILVDLQIPMIGWDVGGTRGRTVTIHTGTGVFMVETQAHGKAELCNFKAAKKENGC